MAQDNSIYGLPYPIAFPVYRADDVSQGGRESYEVARTAWARSPGTQADDGLNLGELTRDPKNLREIVAAVATCGTSGDDARAAVKRLVDAHLVNSSV